MMYANRRQVILGASALALAGPAAFAQDLSKLNEPSPIGEMALGAETAKVTIIEYASASCPHCANFHKTTFEALKKDYIDTGKVRFVMREFPHNDAGLAGFMVARCAPPDKYFPIMGMIFEQQEKWFANPIEGLFSIAQLAGMSRADFDACLKNEQVAKGILDVRKQAEVFGVDSIPTFFINGQRYDGEQTIEDMKKVIDPLLG
jgi:protein-disulfide isomerase